MFDLTWVADPNAWIALATLPVMEIVLGIDNIIFIAVLADKLPENQRDSARRLGLIFAMVTRILLLFCIAWMIRLQEPIIDFYSIALSGRDLIMICGGLFLLVKGTHEIHDIMEGEDAEEKETSRKVGFGSVLFQIVLLDVVFSLDSVITAVGMAAILAVNYRIAFRNSWGPVTYEAPPATTTLVRRLLIAGIAVYTICVCVCVLRGMARYLLTPHHFWSTKY